MTASVGDRFEVVVGPVAHGGHCVARHDGQVVFVRHSLPGERVIVEVTGIGSGGRFVRADAIEVIDASADRRAVRCRHAGPGGCGGCDWQHVEPAAQRGLKAAVVAESMRRIAKVDVEVIVESVQGDTDGLGWRTRVTYAVGNDGHVGFYRHRSHSIVSIDACPLVTDAVASIDLADHRWPAGSQVSAVATSIGERGVRVRPLPDAPEARESLLANVPVDVAVLGLRGSARLHERVGEQQFLVALDGFWQVHPGAPEALVRAVVDGLGARPGDHVVDLYAGAGLFGISLAPILGPGGRVDLVESEPSSCAAARRTVHANPTVRVHEAPVDAWLRQDAPRRCDLVVLDPPEAGVGKGVLDRLVRLSPRRIAYVSCDPASLARDVGALARLGWQMTTLRAFDLFPTTHHVECVAMFEPLVGDHRTVLP